MQFLYPLMTEEEEAEYYNGYYRKQDERRFRVMSLIDQQNQSLRHYEQYAQIYNEIIGSAASLLEIGAGTGGFLRFVRNKHPEIEFVATERCGENADLIRQCFGSNAVVQSLDDLGDRKFDCVAALGVFEHLRNGYDFLAEMRQCVKPGGTLVLKVPNKNYVMSHNYKLDIFKKFMYMKQHYYTYTERAFEIMADRSGFEVSGFYYVQAWGLDNHLSWLRYGKSRDFSDFTNLLSRETLDSYNNDLIRAKLTDTFMAVLRRV